MMPSSSSPPSSSGPQREREVRRYLECWQLAQGSSLNVALNVDSITSVPDLQGRSGYTPRPSPDKALTAFGQLVVLRLGVKRAMVSLIDSDNQTILAEATRSLRLGDLNAAAKSCQTFPAEGGESDAVRRVENDLWLGATVLTRREAICEQCFTNTYTATDPSSGCEPYTATALVVPDCRLDPRFQNRPYVQSEPGVRFYAGVPVISRNGHMIGTLSVSDPTPRDVGLTVDEVQFMQSVAETVMEHLEWARDRVDRFKGERIVRGLAAFIEGSSTVNEDEASSPTKDEPPQSPSSALRPPEVFLNASKRPLSRANSVRTAEARSNHDASAGPTRNGSPSASSAAGGSGRNPHRGDKMSRMFQRASDILRYSTLADGVVFFGTLSNARQAARVRRPGEGGVSSDDDDRSRQVLSGSEGVGMDSSDSDGTAPLARPCKVLASSLGPEATRVNQNAPALSLGVLEKYFHGFPKGKSFSFTEEGAGVSSEDDSASDREPRNGSAGNAQDRTRDKGRPRRPKMDHKELLAQIPGAKVVVFMPLFDYFEDKLAGGCFIWTSVTGRMMNLDEDLSYLRAFGNSIMSQVARLTTQKNEAAKTTFIASMSHELRSPLHGILGAAEFLKGSSPDSYQSLLITSIFTCGRTLLDTLNHVLDYSKINRLGRVHMRKSVKQNKQLLNLSTDSLESLSMTAVVDLGNLVEEVVDTISAGHTFKNLSSINPKQIIKLTKSDATEPLPVPGLETPGFEGSVCILLDICPNTSWLVNTQPGALRRIILNLLGNAVKYTSSGYVLVSLRGQPSPDGSRVDACIRVVDTGKGMSTEFQENRLFVPFSQEDSFQPGTGLGLSIVKQVVDSLRGTLQVKSQQYKGTEVCVRLSLTAEPGEPSTGADAMRSIVQQTKGLQFMFLDKSNGADASLFPTPLRKLSEVVGETCAGWLQMKPVREPKDASTADVYMYCQKPEIEALKARLKEIERRFKETGKISVIILCLNGEETARASRDRIDALSNLTRIVDVIPEPCGPRKLGKILSQCLTRVSNLSMDPSGIIRPDGPMNENIRRKEDTLEGRVKPGRYVDVIKANGVLDGAQGQEPVLSPPPLDPETPALATAETKELSLPETPREEEEKKPTHVLLVDDNKINLQLLVMLMKKCGFTYEQAENGQEALDRFKESCASDVGESTINSARRFQFVLMDISMPVMNGIESTKHIREFEREQGVPQTTIIALTGLASADAQHDAKLAGFDIFLPKPVRFAELKALLTVSSMTQGTA